MLPASAFLGNADLALTNLHAGSFSVAGWVRPKSTSIGTTTLLISPAWKLVLNSDGTLTFSILNSPSAFITSLSTTTVVNNDWNFFAVMYDTTLDILTLVLNADTVSGAFTAAADSTVGSFVPVFQLGAKDRTNPSFSQDTSFDLDETTVWGRVLSTLELTALYARTYGNPFPFLGGELNLIFQANLINTPAKPVVIGSTTDLWQLIPLFNSDTQQFVADLNLLFTGIQASRGYSWHADNFNDKVILAQKDNRAQYWLPPATVSMDLPGLPSNDAKWDGVFVFAGHVCLFKDDRFKYSDVDDFTDWLPVDTTAVSAVLPLTADFVQPAPGGQVTVSVTNPVAQVASVSLSGSMTFGSVAVGHTSAAVLNIINTGTVPLIVTGVSLPTGFSGSFSGTVAVGASAPMVVTFAPTSAIAYAGTISVASNATVGTSTIPVSGTGTGSTFSIVLSGVLGFGPCVLGHSLNSALLITNTGNATVNVTGITLPAGYSGSFTGAIAAGATRAVSITFAPTAATSFDGNIIVHSTATASPASIPVSGVGTPSLGPTIFLTDNGSLNFGSRTVGSTTTGTLTIYNPSGSAVNVLSLTLPSGSIFSGSFSGVIGPYGSASVSVGFTPAAVASYGGLITVATAGGVLGINTIAVQGSGTPAGPVINLSGNLSFGLVPVGESLQSYLQISNTGATNLVVTSISYPAGYSGSFSGTITPGTHHSVAVTFSPISAIEYDGTVTVNCSGSPDGVNTITASGLGYNLPQPVALVAGQFVTLSDTRGGVTYYNYYTVVSMNNTSLILKLMDLTGATPSGQTLPADGREFFTIDANEAGEQRVTGAQMNGPIFRGIPQGDYAYLFKERSIQSVQYTGKGNGTFFIHNEVMGEGLIGRGAVVDRKDGTMVFLGHRQLYAYSGGPTPQPVCLQTTRQLYNELDRTRLDAIKLFHHENKNEIWVKYPISGGFRVMVWNYLEDSATIDDYDPAVEFTAFGLVDWSSDVAWNQLADTLTWSLLDDLKAWEDWEAGGVDHVPVIASDDGTIKVFGLTYDRDGAGYLSISETMDFDLQDPDVWKYVDTVVLGLQVLNPSVIPSYMTVQVCGQGSLGEPMLEFDPTNPKQTGMWSAPKQVLVNGSAPIPIKVNPGGAGRYIRVRFSSSDPGVQWRLSSFEIHCRQGGLY
jgi:hypothetical protein